MVRRKRKKRSLIGQTIMLVSTILTLNLIGVSYAYWENGFEINTSISTGNINPHFSNNYMALSARDNIHVNFDNNHNIMNISGVVKPGFTGVVYYGIQNDGTIPVKYDYQNYFSNLYMQNKYMPSTNMQNMYMRNTNMQNMHMRNTNMQNMYIQGANMQNTSQFDLIPDLGVLVLHPNAPGNYSFTYVLPYSQWNK